MEQQLRAAEAADARATPTPSTNTAPRGQKVKVLERAITILDCFTLDSPELGVGEVSRLTGISKGTVHRLLMSLSEHRIIEQNPMTKRYRLGFKLFELGNRAIARVDHIERTEPYLRDLARQTGETVHLAVLDHGKTLYVAKVEGWHALRMPSQVGKHLPAYCTGVGKALLAYLDEPELNRLLDEDGLPAFTPHTITNRRRLKKELAEIRKTGFSVDNEEIEVGLRCIGAPVRDYSGRVVAAVSIAGPSTRITDVNLPELAARVIDVGRNMSAALGAGV